MSKLSLTEATMLALQGKLEESKPATHRRSKKQENIDVNVDDKTAVSVIGNETIVDTEKATIIVDKKEDEFVPETSDGIVDDTSLPMEAPDEDVVEVPVDGDETIIPEDEVPVEQADEDEAVLDAEADVDLPLGDTETEEDNDEDKEESKKVESKKLNEDFWSSEMLTWEEWLEEWFEREANYRAEQDTTVDVDSMSPEEIERLDSKLYDEVRADMEANEEKLKKEYQQYIQDYINNADDYIAQLKKQHKKESKKVESVEIEVSDDGKEVEVTTDNGEEVEVKDETPEEDVEADNVDNDEETSIEAPEDVEESKKVESIDTEHATEDIYKSSNLFKAMCDEVEDMTCEDEIQPTKEQIDEIVDAFINGYDFVWEDIHIALRDEIDRVMNKKPETENLKPRYEAKSKRKSLGKVTEKVIKYSSKTFKEALNKYYTTNTKTIESVDLTKFNAGRNFIKMEVKLTNKDGMVASKILEMKEIAKNKNFTKYAMVENSRIKNESKSNISMLVATNKDKVLECKYIKK